MRRRKAYRKKRGGKIDRGFKQTGKVIKGIGGVLKTLGIGKQVKSARNIVSKGALGMLKRKMATM